MARACTQAKAALGTQCSSVPGLRRSSTLCLSFLHPQTCPVPLQRLSSNNCCLTSASERLLLSPPRAGTVPRPAAGCQRSQAARKSGASPKASAPRALSLWVFRFPFLHFNLQPLWLRSCAPPRSSRSLGDGGGGRHPPCQCVDPADTEHPSLNPLCKEDTPPPNYFLWHRATRAQPHAPLGGTWQQVPAPHRLILLPATGQGLTGINTSTSPLTTCLSIRGADLPAPHAAGGGAAQSRLASRPAGHRVPGGEGAAGASAEPEAWCLLGTPWQGAGGESPPAAPTLPNHDHPRQRITCSQRSTSAHYP